MDVRMMRRALIVVLQGALLLSPVGLPGGGPVRARSSQDVGPVHSPIVPGEVLVKFAPGASPARAAGILAEVGAARAGEIETLDVARWRVPTGQERAVSAALTKVAGVVYAEPNVTLRAHLVPDDPYYGSYQWPHPLINSPLAWDITTGSSAVTVAVVDTGVDIDHPELQAILTAGYDYVNDDGSPDDDHGHGTHVAGIVAAIGNNHQGIAGMGWQTRIMPLKVLDHLGYGDTADTSTAIVDAVNNGADIVNVSLGGVEGTQTLYNAVKYAHNHGVLVVASAGNCGGTNYSLNGCTYQDQPVYPAAYDTEVFAVAATTSADSQALFSNRGDYIDIAAPGQFIYSTVRNNSYASVSGTSQAAPHVAGLAALLLAEGPTLTPAELQAHIEAGAVDLGSTGWDPDFGGGRIDALEALVSVAGLEAPDLLPIDNADRNGAYLVDWSEVPYAAGYVVEVDDDGAFTSPEVAYSGSASYVEITGQDAGTWTYRVRATRESAGVNSAWSETESVEVGLDAPLLHAISNNGADSYSVSWDAVAAASAYRLQEAASADFVGATDVYAGTGLSHAVSGQDGGTWTYRVQATLGAVAGPWSDMQSATVLPDPPLLAPIVSGADPDSYMVTWSASTGADDYRLQESPDLAFTAVVTRYIGAATEYTVTGQRAGTWHYRVEAGNAVGWSVPGNTEPFTVTVPSVPVPVLAPIPESTTGTYSVTWSTVQTATGYILEESTTPWFEAPALAYTGSLTRHVVTEQLPGTWHYRVRAQTGAGDSPWSPSKSATVLAYVYLPLVMR